MTRSAALKGLFISLGAVLILFVLREPIADIASDLAFYEWRSFWYDVFYERWALGLALGAACFFGYRLTADRS